MYVLTTSSAFTVQLQHWLEGSLNLVNLLYNRLLIANSWRQSISALCKHFGRMHQCRLCGRTVGHQRRRKQIESGGARSPPGYMAPAPLPGMPPAFRLFTRLAPSTNNMFSSSVFVEHMWMFRMFVFKLYAFALVFSERELKFMFAMSSSVRLSVCLSSVCNVGASYSDDWNFWQCFYAIWYLGHPWPFGKTFTKIVPGEPLRLGS